MQYEENIFTKILRKELPATIIYESDVALAFKDISPKAKTHILVIPKGRYVDFSHFVASSNKQEVATFFSEVNKIATNVCGLKHFQLHVNNGAPSGQEVFHFHVHILSSQQSTTAK